MTKLKLKLMKGLPASGKSTYAKNLVETDKSYGRVNRDDLREMLFNGHWTPYNEKIVIAVEKAIADVLLAHGRNVVIDDTNLGSKHSRLWEEFVNSQTAISEVDIELEQSIMNVSAEECVRRDAARPNPVGPNVINKMAARYKLLEWPDKPIVLVDIDGTLADGEHRLHHIQKTPKDWDSYLNLVGFDKPIEFVFKWVAELSKDHTIVIVSGRGAEREKVTREWFDMLWDGKVVPRFPVFQYFFRNKGDRRPDDQVKLEVLDLLPSKPVLVIDDRPSVIRAWRSRGLKVIPVRGAVEEF